MAVRAAVLVVLLVFVLALATGCGQKGPLYLPDEQESAEQAS